MLRARYCQHLEEGNAPYGDPRANMSGLRSPPMSALHPPIIGEHYQVERVLGRGAMGRVYLAHEIGSGLEVAIKVAATSDAEALERFEREMDVSARVDHSHVVEVLDYGTTEVPTADGHARVPFLVMEWLRGRTLGELLRSEIELPLERALELVRQAALGLQAAHDRGIVHRDVKPDNLFVCMDQADGDHIKLLDFGLASHEDTDEPAPQSGMVMGTVEYMAPEQIVTEPVDPRTDIYALGVVMFRLLTEELPFDLALKSELLAHQLVSPAPPLTWLKDLPPGTEEIVLRALRKHPDNRYASMLDLVADIELVQAGRGEEIGVPSLVRNPDAFEPSTEFGRQAIARLKRVQRASGMRYRALTPSHLRIKHEEVQEAERLARQGKTGA